MNAGIGRGFAAAIAHGQQSLPKEGKRLWATSFPVFLVSILFAVGSACQGGVRVPLQVRVDLKKKTNLSHKPRPQAGLQASGGAKVQVRGGIPAPKVDVQVNVPPPKLDLSVEAPNVDVQGQIDGNYKVRTPVVEIVELEADVPEFFGVSLVGAQNVVFVLDVSGSMVEDAQGRLVALGASAWQAPPTTIAPSVPASANSPGAPPLVRTQGPPLPTQEPVPPPDAQPVVAPARAPRKIDVARAELIAALQQLPGDTAMNVLFFNQFLEAFDTGLNFVGEQRLASLIDFVNRVEPDGQTALGPALRAAFLMNPDRVVLLSDGLGNVGGDADDILRDAREAMLGGVRIDTVGLGVGQDRDLLGAMARESGGLYQAF